MRRSKLIFAYKYQDSEITYDFHEYNPNPMNILGRCVGTTIKIRRDQN